MSDVEKILSRVRAGYKIRFSIDHYGQERVELQARWLPVKRSFQLSRDEVIELKRSLGRRPQPQR